MRFNKPEQLAVRVLGHFPLLKAKIKFIYSLVLSLLFRPSAQYFSNSEVSTFSVKITRFLAILMFRRKTIAIWYC